MHYNNVRDAVYSTPVAYSGAASLVTEKTSYAKRGKNEIKTCFFFTLHYYFDRIKFISDDTHTVIYISLCFPYTTIRE